MKLRKGEKSGVYNSLLCVDFYSAWKKKREIFDRRRRTRMYRSNKTEREK